MIPTDTNLSQLFMGFSAAFNKALQNSQSFYKEVSMIVPSVARGNNYGWLGATPRLREWIGSRVIHDLSAHTYYILNRTFENTVSVTREDIEDDQFAVFGSIFERIGLDAAQHPDEMVFGLLSTGFTTLCYDGTPFFSASHPVGDDPRTLQTLVSNVQTQATPGPAWFLLDCSKPIRALVFQERLPYELTPMTEPTRENVFMNNQMLYGVRARCNVGFGVWQLAFGSTADLTMANYAVARQAMMSQVSDTGRPLGIKPTHLVAPPALESQALTLLRSTIINATTNPWQDSAKPVVTQFLLQPSPGRFGGPPDPGSAVAT